MRERLSDHCGGARILLKREDLNHTGAHKINNTMGQGLLAHYMGKKRVIAETGAGQHGVASATVAARLDQQCVVYMGETDIHRQAINVFRMKLLGAEVRSVTSGSSTLKDALNEAMRDWVTNVDDTFYIIGTVAGPHPYPEMVRDFNAVVGREARRQMLEQYECTARCTGGLRGWWFQRAWPVSPVYRGHAMWPCTAWRRPAGAWPAASMPRPCAPANRACCTAAKPTCWTMTPGRFAIPIRSRPGLDYPGVGPEHSWLKDTGRAQYVGIDDKQALAATHDADPHGRHPAGPGKCPRHRLRA